MLTWDNLLEKAVTLAAGTGGLAAVWAWVKARNEAKQAASLAAMGNNIDMRRMVDQTSSDVLTNLTRLWQECEKKHTETEKRLDLVEAQLVVLNMRDYLLRAALARSGVELPDLPTVPGN